MTLPLLSVADSRADSPVLRPDLVVLDPRDDMLLAASCTSFGDVSVTSNELYE